MLTNLQVLVLVARRGLLDAIPVGVADEVEHGGAWGDVSDEDGAIDKRKMGRYGDEILDGGGIVFPVEK